jgi:hypothetical protein
MENEIKNIPEVIEGTEEEIIGQINAVPNSVNAVGTYLNLTVADCTTNYLYITSTSTDAVIQFTNKTNGGLIRLIGDIFYFMSGSRTIPSNDFASVTAKSFVVPTASSDSLLQCGGDAITKKALLLGAFPVGSIYMSTSSANPSTWLGGSWSLWGSGKVPVSYASGDSDFGTIEKTGGSKSVTLSKAQMPSHYHYLTDDKDTTHLYGNPASGSSNPGSFWFPNEYAIDNAFVHQNRAYTMRTDEVGGGEAHSNLQPYITCYMWKRTA